MKIVTLPNIQDNCLLHLKKVYNEHYKRNGIAKEYNKYDYLRIGCFVNTYFMGGDYSVLDVGTGPGVLLNWMNMQPNIFAVGIDNKEYGTFCDFSGTSNRKIMDAASMAFAENSFDLVFCLEVLEHLD